MENKKQTKTGLKKEAKKQALLHAAAKVFSEKGYIQCSIKDITDLAHISVGSFYSYFDNKEMILDAIYDEILTMSINLPKKVSKKSMDNMVKQFTQALTISIYTYISNEDLSRILFVKSMGINESFEAKRFHIIEQIRLYIRRILEHLRGEHQISMMDLDVTSVLLTQSVFGAITYWLNNKLTCDTHTMLMQICTYHLNALSIPYEINDVTTYIEEIIQQGV